MKNSVIIKGLCQIEQEEVEMYELLCQNQSTMITLMQIKAEKGLLSDTVRADLNNRLKSINRSISTWWENITLKYQIPYYTDHEMRVNFESREIYIVLEYNGED